MNYILAIAVDKYENSHFPRLNNAKLDTERFLKVLKNKYGFTLVQEPLFDENANRKNIIEAVSNLGTFLTASDNIIIYFAGHGTVNPKTKKGFWIPSDATSSVSDFIPNSTIIDAIEGIEANHLVLISDSCFSGSFLSHSRLTYDYHYEKLEAQKSRWLLASGRQELVSDGQPGVGSPFAIALNDFLERNTASTFSILELSTNVAKMVGTSSKQQPISAHLEGLGHEGGQMVFRLSNAEAVEPMEAESEIQKIVVPVETAEKLRTLGFTSRSIFAYYREGQNLVVKKNEGGENFYSNAYINDEIMELIPDEIEVTVNTFLAREDGYDQVNKFEINNLFAEVTFQRTGLKEDRYMAICRCKGRMVAFSKNENGTFNNLIRFGKNQAEAGAEMLIALTEEKKIEL